MRPWEAGRPDLSRISTISPGIFLKEIIANNKPKARSEGDESSDLLSDHLQNQSSVPINIGNKFEDSEFNSLVGEVKGSISTSSPTSFETLIKKSELMNNIKQMSIVPNQISENPDLLRIIFSEKYLNKIKEKKDLARLLTLAVRGATHDKSTEISRLIVNSKATRLFSMNTLYALQTVIEQSIGEYAYLAMVEESQNPRTIPVAAMHHIEVITRLLPRVVDSRDSNLIDAEEGNLGSKSSIAKAFISGGVGAAALKIVKRATEDRSLRESAKQVMDQYFKVMINFYLRHVPELDQRSLMSEELLSGYFLHMNQRISYSEKAVYLNYSSLLQLFEYLNTCTFSTKDLAHKMLKSYMQHESSQLEDTKGFKYKLTEEELLSFIELIEKGRIRDPIIQSFIGYLAVNSDSIPIISHMVKNYSLTEASKRVAFEKVAVELLITNKESPKEAGKLLENLQLYIKSQTKTQFGLLIENVVVPVLQKNYTKAWSSAYHGLIKPGQHDLVSKHVLRYVMDHHRKLFTTPDGIYKQNLMLIRE